MNAAAGLHSQIGWLPHTLHVLKVRSVSGKEEKVRVHMSNYK